jgi:hypothetical protein
MSAPVTDPVEALLAAALTDARTDDRWGIAPKAQALTSVRRAATRQRTRNAGLALVAVAGATAGLSALGAAAPKTQAIVQQPGDGTSGQPVAGISPEWVPQSGDDWILDKHAYDEFVASHTMPSSRPHTVQSPAPPTEYSARLQRDVVAALGSSAGAVRQDAPDGDGAAAAIHAKLPDGTPVEIRREPLQAPISDQFGGDGPQYIPTRRSLPTGSVLLSIAHSGYGWQDGWQEGAAVAITITPDGTETSWFAPLTIPLSTVIRWAEESDKG